MSSYESDLSVGRFQKANLKTSIKCAPARESTLALKCGIVVTGMVPKGLSYQGIKTGNFNDKWFAIYFY